MVGLRRTVRGLLLGTGLVAMAVSGMVLASAATRADTVDLRGEEPPTTDQLIQALKPSQPVRTRGLTTRGLTTRAIRPVMNPDGTPATAAAAPPEPVKPPGVMLTVNFAFDSAEISPESRLVLQRLGQALVSRDLSTYRFQIDGHTDAKGTSAYNRDLSERRAAAVRAFLVADLRVAPNRLTSHGYGEDQLLDPQAPDSGVNRRVEITNIGQ
ncbi:OmpA family protein [Zavarzinia sp. CC-PAN008]|uniref:OmpA family protein n=1 Tax=Zavarzinia sp. CC-PAN008 TaxID=3243332 RepID=UPI003F746188